MSEPAPAVVTRRKGPRVAIVHYWLVGMRGGEKVLEALCRMFPEAELFTHVYVPDRISPALNAHKVHTTRIARLPFAPRLYQKYLPLMPRALEEIDLTGFDLVISSEAGPAKGVIAPPDAPHLCYCHSPMRYLWDQYHVYRDGAGALTRALMPYLAHELRQWDVTSAARVDAFAANSGHVAARIRKYWRREAEVVHPPVAVADFAPVAAGEVGDFYLWAGELAPYKRPDLAVEAFTRMGKPLVVIGGPDKTRKALAAQAGDNVRFLGQVPFPTLKDHMARCKALIFPGEEDFGIVPVEVMASGRPVIAYGRGGALDTVRDGETGLLFREQSVEGLTDAVARFEAAGLDRLPPEPLVAHAARFDEGAFRAGILRLLAGQGVAPGAVEAAPGRKTG
ncbi:glycosyltransferase involved in cell wall biosynthesis [Rhodovulum iodosum]|uniref:Glycosyltransferase involved in cell wall biosynthesis n=1 Tax=Rhodovulum iodosum TaxID=68291 RepID=A0ABV3XXD9_9RHOB|nr:glycosyltransferase [Rhodovulum robiginosum]RSK38359.1 glycosyltransferase family 4 protein [Rhodovulum robiginosum]